MRGTTAGPAKQKRWMDRNTTPVVRPLSPEASAGPMLVAAGPAFALAERWQEELEVLRHRSPTSDAVTTLADCVHELLEALAAGRDLCLQLTIAEAHVVSRIPVSTLRWLCKHKAEEIGARKRNGVWYIDRAKFEHYLPRGDKQAPAGGSTEAA